MITFFTYMLELPIFGRMARCTMSFDSRDKILFVLSWTEIMTSYPLFQNTFTLKRSRVAIFADTIKIVKCLLKQSLNT